jgi:hypothetical protein
MPMKYFTAERYLANLAVDQSAWYVWEAQINLYGARLAEIVAHLPESVRLFQDTCHLHDAAFEKWNSLLFSIEPENRRLQFVVRCGDVGNLAFLCLLRYELAPPGYIERLLGSYRLPVDCVIHELPCFRRNKSYWLYDEWDFLGEADGALGRKSVCSHDFLLSDGREITVYFTDFEFIYAPLDKGVVQGKRKDSC